MNQQIIVPIVLFACVTYAFKAVLDAGMRYHLLRTGGSEEILRSLIQGEELQRRHASLRWGLVLIAVAIGFGVIQSLGWQEVNPGVIAILAAATGFGNMAFYAISRRLP